MQKNTEHTVTVPTEKESIMKQIKAEQKPVSVEKVQTAERSPQPKPSILASKYPRLKEIEGRRKELQQEIDSLDFQISNMKKRLSSIVREYNFDSVQAFNKELNAAKRENQDYEAACAEYEKTYREKVKDTRSVRNRLRQKEQDIKIREMGRTHQVKQRDKGTR